MADRANTSKEANPAQGTASVRHEAEASASRFPAIMVEAERIAATLMSGIHGRRQAGPGETFWQHRPYAFGDSITRIDWRQSARSADRLYVRQNEWEAAASVWLWRDPSRSMIYQSTVTAPEKRHRANVLAIALSILLAQGGERLGVLAGDDTAVSRARHGATRLFHGRRAPATILEHLDHRETDDTPALPFSARVRPGNTIVLFSDFLMDLEAIDAGVDRLMRLGARGVFCQVIDEAEAGFPFRGRKEFQDTETNDRLLFGNAQTLQAAYRTTFDAHQAALAAMAARAGWPLITHKTNDRAHTALLALINAVTPQGRS
ncbi:MAG: DUF58 domain-containing protein [Pseudomonadota bacterium]